MKTATLDKKVPDFSLPATDEMTFKLSDYLGSHVILYFYPKDSTPGCTQEGKDFTQHMKDFEKEEALIFGVSRDSLTSHQKFKDKQGYPFPLLSDTDEIACKLFDVLKEKNMFGKKVFGIERSTFLINKDGILVKEWRKIKVKGHVEDVLSELKTINN